MHWQEGGRCYGWWKTSRGFNSVLGQEVLDSVAKSCKKRWCRWLVNIFRPRKFEVEWDGKVRGRGSPLSPVVFLIWMAPILEKMQEAIRKQVSCMWNSHPSLTICVWILLTGEGGTTCNGSKLR